MSESFGNTWDTITQTVAKNPGPGTRIINLDNTEGISKFRVQFQSKRDDEYRILINDGYVYEIGETLKDLENMMDTIKITRDGFNVTYDWGETKQLKRRGDKLLITEDGETKEYNLPR